MAASESVWTSSIKRMTIGPAAETLEDPNDPTSTEWDVTGDMADDTAKVTYTHSGGSGTLTQPSAKLATPAQNSVPYRFTYTISATTTPANSTAVITSAFALTAVSLDLTAGVNTVDFTSAAGASSADFVISVTSTDTSVWTLDTMTLTHGSAEQIQTGRQEMLSLTIRAEANNTGTITLVDDAFASEGVPLNAGDVAEFDAEVYDTLDIRDMFWRASVDTDGFHWSYRQ